MPVQNGAIRITLSYLVFISCATGNKTILHLRLQKTKSTAQFIEGPHHHPIRWKLFELAKYLSKAMCPNENLELSCKTWKVAFTKFKLYFSASRLELFKIGRALLIPRISILR